MFDGLQSEALESMYAGSSDDLSHIFSWQQDTTMNKFYIFNI